MKIVYKDIDDLIPYENNPRFNDNAVDAVANSIQEFGFKVPCVIDKDNVIVNGHTRVKACKMLGIRKIPCIIANDLTDEQIKAFRLADNKVGEIAEWNNELLEQELQSIQDIDLSDFGFDLSEFDFEEMQDDYNDDYTESHTYKTFNHYNMLMFNPDECIGKWQMPIVRKQEVVPTKLIRFNYAKQTNDREAGIHFFTDDYRFERCWNNPSMYLDILGEFECVLTPDFSLYMDMSMPTKIWNVYRSRLLGQYWQNNGLKVIPTVQWAEKETYEFCFDGIEEGSIVATSTVGVKRETDAFDVWKDGMNEMIKRIKPSMILCYGGKVEFDYQGIEVKYYDIETHDMIENEWRKYGQ